jgi:peptidyl-prolyl cis-trans isomerase B (cyclophilin B)
MVGGDTTPYHGGTVLIECFERSAADAMSRDARQGGCQHVKTRTRICLSALMALLLPAVLMLGGCGGDATVPELDTQEQAATDTSAGAEAQGSTTNSEGATLYTPEYQPTGAEIATFETNKGTIVVELYGKDAPVHVGNFVELVEKGFYDDTKFHRYEPGFVVQGGDPQTTELDSDAVVQAVQTGNPPLGTGGPGYVIKGEFDPQVNPNKHVVGALGMARTNDPDSAGSQFYFALQPLTMLDGQYTVFGVVTEGLDVMQDLRIGDTIKSIKISGVN